MTDRGEVKAQEKLAKILNLHQRQKDSGICWDCKHVYPCPTVRLASGT